MNPGRFIPAELRKAGEGESVQIDLNRPMDEIRKELSKYPVATRLSLNGTIIVGRDIAHAKLNARLEAGEGMPQYMKDHPILYAGPAKTPKECLAVRWGQRLPDVWTRMWTPSKQRRKHGDDCQRKPQPAGDRRM